MHSKSVQYIPTDNGMDGPDFANRNNHYETSKEKVLVSVFAW